MVIGLVKSLDWSFGNVKGLWKAKPIDILYWNEIQSSDAEAKDLTPVNAASQKGNESFPCDPCLFSPFVRSKDQDPFPPPNISMIGQHWTRVNMLKMLHTNNFLMLEKPLAQFINRLYTKQVCMV